MQLGLEMKDGRWQMSEQWTLSWRMRRRIEMGEKAISLSDLDAVEESQCSSTYNRYYKSKN